VASLFRFALTIFVLGIFGCGSGGGGGGGGDVPAPAPVNDVGSIVLTSNSTTVRTNDSTTINVRLLTASGQLVTGSKTVVFTLSLPSLASVTPSVTTTTGLATVTFTANGSEGSVELTAEVDGKSESLTIQISNQTASSISLAAGPAALTVGGTSVVSATVLDANGAPMPDGTMVSFSVNNAGLGAIVPSASVIGGAGVAQATFSASKIVGTVKVTATSGSASMSVDISISGSPSGSIEFLSAIPQIIAIKGAGGVETSEVKFLVKDVNGDPVLGSQTVLMTLSGPNGGEFLSGVPVGTENGVAKVQLNSGTIPGTVTITATVPNTNLSTSSGVIAIGGGIPSATHFSLSATKLKLEGFDIDGLESLISVRLADRYGNFNVLAGTAVSFYSECGAIDRAINLNNEGFGTVRFRTQEPRPQILPINNDIRDRYLNALGVTLTNLINPHNGICTIVAVVDGEERFIDSNATGSYELGETFFDTYDDVHLDKDDDPLDLDLISFNRPHDPAFEDLIYDKNSNGFFDGKNLIWDASKKIVKHFKIGLTYDRSAPEITISQKNVDNTFSEVLSNTLVNGRDVNFAIHDLNFNDPIPGTTYEISVTNVQQPSVTKHTFTDNSGIGATIFSIKPVIIDPTKTATLTIKWSWKGTDYSRIFTVI